MSTEHDPEALPVGEKIKRLREGANLSIQELADRADISATELERIEQDMISPALGVLVKICEGLRIRLGHFFDQGPRKLYSLVRAEDAGSVTRFASKSGTDYGYEYRSLASEKRERGMEPFLVTSSPPSDPTGEPVELEGLSTHSGEEFIYVLEGEIEVQLQDQSFVLKPGDSLYYDATVPHRVLHRGDKVSRVVAVMHVPRDS
jgi:transcriptional regulator with XRE-family HTH domain